MSYRELQAKHCTFKVGDNVVLSRAWKQGERGFTWLWNITHARWIGRKLQVIGVHPDGISVHQYVNGRESFLVPWFVLERFEEKKQATQTAESVPAGYEPVKIVQSQPMREFAGFWVDGAVRQPDQKHCDCTGFVIIKSKRTSELMAQTSSKQNVWDQWYWLDTTTPTELTPKQAFELSQVIYLSLHKVLNDGDGFVGLEGSPLNSIVNWGGVSEYPQRQQWRVPTDVDKGSLCRVKEDANSEWYESRFLVTDNGKFVARRDEDSFPYSYEFCEVLD